MNHIKPKTWNDISRKDFLKQSILFFGMTALGEVGCKKQVTDAFSKKPEDMQPVFPEPLISNGKVLVFNENITQYRGPEYFYYLLSYAHLKESDVALRNKTVLEVVKNAKKARQKVFVIHEEGSVIHKSERFQNSVQLNLQQQEITIEKMAYQTLISERVSSLLNIEEQFSELMRGKRSDTKPATLDLCQKLAKEQINVYAEHSPLESDLLIYAHMYVSSLLPHFLVARNQNIHKLISFGYKTFKAHHDQRNAQILERAGRLSKSLNAIPIVMMGAGHQIENVPGSEKVKFEQVGINTVDNYPSEYCIFQSLFYPIFEQNYKFITADSVAGFVMINELCQKITPDKINWLMGKLNIYRSKGRITPQELNTEIMEWIIKQIDPPKKSRIWAFVD
jgi:hypothetical protein